MEEPLVGGLRYRYSLPLASREENTSVSNFRVVSLEMVLTKV